MRAAIFSVGVLVARVASAEPTEYPLAITDRPLVLPPGVTELDIAEQFRTYVQDVVDAMGNTTRDRTAFASHRTPELALGHSFGGVQVTGGLGEVADLSVDIDTKSIPGVFGIGFSDHWVRGAGYDYSQSFGVGHKLVVSPGQFAIFGGSAVSLNERTIMPDPATLSPTHTIGVSGRVTGEAQLTSRLGVYATVGAWAPVHQSSSLHSTAQLNTGVTLLFAFRRWDLFTGFSLGDVTRDPATYFAFGFAHRWGL
jgi:hypothetical protein